LPTYICGTISQKQLHDWHNPSSYLIQHTPPQKPGYRTQYLSLKNPAHQQEDIGRTQTNAINPSVSCIFPHLHSQNITLMYTARDRLVYFRLYFMSASHTIHTSCSGPSSHAFAENHRLLQTSQTKVICICLLHISPGRPVQYPTPMCTHCEDSPEKSPTFGGCGQCMQCSSPKCRWWSKAKLDSGSNLEDSMDPASAQSVPRVVTNTRPPTLSSRMSSMMMVAFFQLL
jgi:hypothetical protein